MIRVLLCIRRDVFGVVDYSPNSSGDVGARVAAVILAMSPGLAASEVKTVLADYLGDLPESVARSLCGDPSWVADRGPHSVQLLGVLSEVAFATVTKAGRGGRARWLEPLD